MKWINLKLLNLFFALVESCKDVFPWCISSFPTRFKQSKSSNNSSLSKSVKKKTYFFRLTSFSFLLVSGFILIISLKLFQNPNCSILIGSIIFRSLLCFSFCSSLLFQYSTLSVSQFYNLSLLVFKYKDLVFFTFFLSLFSIPLAFVRSNF